MDDWEQKMRFDFRVQNFDKSPAAAQSLNLPDVKSAWSEVVEIAQKMEEIGGRIAVTDDTGKVVILVDVVEIISHLGAPRNAKPTMIRALSQRTDLCSFRSANMQLTHGLRRTKKWRRKSTQGQPARCQVWGGKSGCA